MSQHHDPVHPDSDHLTVELIADLDEGLLDETSAAHAGQHLAECALCRDVRAALSDVSVGLATLPGLRMPDGVEQRLLESLAAEAAGPATDTASEGVAAPTVVPLDSARSQRRNGWSGHGLGIAAAAAAVLLVGAVLAPSLMNSGTTTADSAVGEGAGTLDRSADAASMSFSVAKTGTQYNATDLNKQVDKLVGSARASAQPTVGSTDLPIAPTPTEEIKGFREEGALAIALDSVVATDPTAAQACLEQYIQTDGVQPIAIDIGTFYDKNADAIEPAAVIVMPNKFNAAKADVWIVDPACSGPDAVFLYFARVDLR